MNHAFPDRHELDDLIADSYRVPRWSEWLSGLICLVPILIGLYWERFREDDGHVFALLLLALGILAGIAFEMSCGIGLQ